MATNPGLVIELTNYSAFQKEMRALDRVLDNLDARLDRVVDVFDQLDTTVANSAKNLKKVFSVFRQASTVGNLANAATNLSTFFSTLSRLPSIMAGIRHGDIENLNKLFGSLKRLSSSSIDLPNIEGLGNFLDSLSKLSQVKDLGNVSGLVNSVKNVVKVFTELSQLHGPRQARFLFLRRENEVKQLPKAIRSIADALRSLNLINPASANAAASSLRAIRSLLTLMASIEIPQAGLFRRKTRLTQLLIGIKPLAKLLVQVLREFESLKGVANLRAVSSNFRALVNLVKFFSEIEIDPGGFFRRKTRLTQFLVGIKPLAKLLRSSVQILASAKIKDPKSLTSITDTIKALTRIIEAATSDKALNPARAKQFGKSIREISKALSEGFSQGDLVSDLEAQGDQAGQGFLGGLRKRLRISSPSRATFEIAQQIGQGLVSGLKTFNPLTVGSQVGTLFVSGLRRSFDGLKSVITGVFHQFERLRDGVSQRVRDIGRSVTDVGRNLFDAGLRTALTGGVIGFLQSSFIGDTADYQQLLRQIEIFGSLTIDQVKQVDAELSKFSAATIFDPNQSADAFLGLQKAGLDLTAALATLPEVGNLAAAAQLDLAAATDLTVRSANAFNIEFTDTKRVVDALVGAADISTAEVATLGQALGFVGNDANNLGISLEDTVAALALLNDKAIVGERAGTGLRAIIASLAAPTKEAGETLAALGIHVFDASGQFVGLENLITQFQGALDGLSTEQIFTQLSALGDRNAISALLALISAADDGSQAFANYRESLTTANTASAVAEAQMDTFKGVVTSLSGSLVNLRNRALGPLLENVLKPFGKEAIKVVNTLAELPQGFLATAAGVGIAATAFITLLGVGQALTGLFLLQLGPAISFVGGLFALVFNPVGVILGVLAMGTALAALLPILLAIGAVGGIGLGALVTGIRDVRNNVGDAGDSFIALKDAVGELFSTVGGLIRAFFEFVGVYRQVRDESRLFGQEANNSLPLVARVIDNITAGVQRLTNGLNEARLFFQFFADARKLSTGDLDSEAIAVSERQNELLERRAQLLEQIGQDRAFAAFDSEDQLGLLSFAVEGERAADGFLESFIERIEAERGETIFSQFLRDQQATIEAAANGNAEAINQLLQITDEEYGTSFDVGAMFDASEGLDSIYDILTNIERIDPGSTRDLIDQVLANPERWSDPFVQAMQELNSQFDTFENQVAGSGSTFDKYTVQAGDYLFKIAEQFGVTVDEILTANPEITDPNLIFSGQEIVIPGVTLGEGASDDLQAELDQLDRQIERDEQLQQQRRRRDTTRELSRIQRTFQQFAQTSIFQRLFGDDPLALVRAVAAVGEIEQSFRRMGRASRRIGQGFRILFSRDFERGFNQIKLGFGQFSLEVLRFGEQLFGFDLPETLEEALAQGDLGKVIRTGFSALSRIVLNASEDIALLAGQAFTFFIRRAFFGLPRLILNVLGIDQFDPVFEAIDSVAASAGNVLQSAISNVFSVLKGDQSVKAGINTFFNDVKTEIDNNPILSDIADRLSFLDFSTLGDKFSEFTTQIRDLITSEEFVAAKDEFLDFLNSLASFGFTGASFIAYTLASGALTILQAAAEQARPALARVTPILRMFGDRLDALAAKITEVTQRDDFDEIARNLTILAGAIGLFVFGPAILATLAAVGTSLGIILVAYLGFKTILDSVDSINLLFSGLKDFIVGIAELDLQKIGAGLGSILSGLAGIGFAFLGNTIDIAADLATAILDLLNVDYDQATIDAIKDFAQGLIDLGSVGSFDELLSDVRELFGVGEGGIAIDAPVIDFFKSILDSNAVNAAKDFFNAFKDLVDAIAAGDIRGALDALLNLITSSASFLPNLAIDLGGALLDVLDFLTPDSLTDPFVDAILGFLQLVLQQIENGLNQIIRAINSISPFDDIGTVDLTAGIDRRIAQREAEKLEAQLEAQFNEALEDIALTVSPEVEITDVNRVATNLRQQTVDAINADPDRRGEVIDALFGELTEGGQDLFSAFDFSFLSATEFSDLLVGLVANGTLDAASVLANNPYLTGVFSDAIAQALFSDDTATRLEAAQAALAAGLGEEFRHEIIEATQSALSGAEGTAAQTEAIDIFFELNPGFDLPPNVAATYLDSINQELQDAVNDDDQARVVELLDLKVQVQQATLENPEDATLSEEDQTLLENAIGSGLAVEEGSPLALAAQNSGLDLSAGLAQGLRDGVAEVTTAATETATAVQDTLDSIFEIQSPSQWAIRTGGLLMEGFNLGVQQKLPLLMISFDLLSQRLNTLGLTTHTTRLAIQTSMGLAALSMIQNTQIIRSQADLMIETLNALALMAGDTAAALAGVGVGNTTATATTVGGINLPPLPQFHSGGSTTPYAPSGGGPFPALLRDGEYVVPERGALILRDERTAVPTGFTGPHPTAGALSALSQSTNPTYILTFEGDFIFPENTTGEVTPEQIHDGMDLYFRRNPIQAKLRASGGG